MEETTAKQFGSPMPEVTEKVLKELIKRKDEEKRWKSAVSKAGLILIILFAFLMFYFFSAKQGLMDRFSFTAFHAAVFSDPILWLFGLGLLFGFFRLQHVSKKYEEADDDFEELRCELIERSEELWSEPEEWRNRHHIFTLLEEEYGINLFHK